MVQYNTGTSGYSVVGYNTSSGPSGYSVAKASHSTCCGSWQHGHRCQGCPG
ncbi:hypothetical protein HOL21_01850 [Candidatus Woesearchaeota archaeon]|jgi:hypothetical protein|nr:hypothetical protein [Candidatus Woesearchaeota archaeon]MBT5396937.1 hypothetical protein [Candidatus Woesearchaeota archaeon]MBT5924901.1 hypothetical protein [Candidatus Woesearchaeota archaeon]MBT6367130.1 hypothetical protein [Candidatus Woesearchaeota archaeon]MBT7762296.1 hypothetical protein [Candidatus Woesearchaeota archaeon]